MSESQMSFEWLPTQRERLSEARYLLRRSWLRWLTRTIAIYCILAMVLILIVAGTQPDYPKGELIWLVYFGVVGVGLLICPAHVYCSYTSSASRGMTIDNSGFLVRFPRLRRSPHRIHWSRLDHFEEFDDGYGVSFDHTWSAYWIPRRVIGDREAKFCEFVAAHQALKGSESASTAATL
jgi:hypothetical protein